MYRMLGTALREQSDRFFVLSFLTSTWSDSDAIYQDTILLRLVLLFGSGGGLGGEVGFRILRRR